MCLLVWWGLSSHTLFVSLNSCVGGGKRERESPEGSVEAASGQAAALFEWPPLLSGLALSWPWGPSGAFHQILAVWGCERALTDFPRALGKVGSSTHSPGFYDDVMSPMPSSFLIKVPHQCGPPSFPEYASLRRENKAFSEPFGSSSYFEKPFHRCYLIESTWLWRDQRLEGERLPGPCPRSVATMDLQGSSVFSSIVCSHTTRISAQSIVCASENFLGPHSVFLKTW